MIYLPHHKDFWYMRFSRALPLMHQIVGHLNTPRVIGLFNFFLFNTSNQPKTTYLIKLPGNNAETGHNWPSSFCYIVKDEPLHFSILIASFQICCGCVQRKNYENCVRNIHAFRHSFLIIPLTLVLRISLTPINHWING